MYKLFAAFEAGWKAITDNSWFPWVAFLTVTFGGGLGILFFVFSSL